MVLPISAQWQRCCRNTVKHLNSTTLAVIQDVNHKVLHVHAVRIKFFAATRTQPVPKKWPAKYTAASARSGVLSISIAFRMTFAHVRTTKMLI